MNQQHELAGWHITVSNATGVLSPELEKVCESLDQKLEYLVKQELASFPGIEVKVDWS